MPRGLTSPPLRLTCARYGCDKQFYSYPDRRGSTGKYQKFCCRACYQSQRKIELESARRRKLVAAEEGLHFLQDAAEKFAAAGKPLFAAECYALVERLAAQAQREARP